MLIEKNNIGSINATSGGTINLQNGATISLPANGIVVQSSNVAFSSTVNIAMSWIDPTEVDLLHKMPGDLRGIDENGAEKIMQTYGMLMVELTSNSGDKLQIATGKKAGLKFPLPQKMLSTAPATIPLWSFNETNGLWKQEGIATKSGNTYIAEVGHFSCWNTDFPYTNAATFNATFIDQNGNPLKWTRVDVTDATSNYTGAYGYTDETGFAQGRVPENMALTAHLYKYYSMCATSNLLGNLNMGPFGANTDNSLGTKTINIPVITTYTATITGILKDCSGSPAPNGKLVVTYTYGLGNYLDYKYVTSDASGNFSLQIEMCSASKAINYYAADANDNNITATTNVIVNAGNNNLGNIVVCGSHRIKANVVNCNNQPVAVGYLNAKIDGNAVYLPIRNGILDFSFTPTNQTPYIYYSAADQATGETSPPTGLTLNAGINNLGTLVACVTHTISGTVVDCNNAPLNSGYVNINLNGANYNAGIVNGNYTLNCTPSNANPSITYYALSNDGLIYSASATATIHLGGNTLPPIQLCPTHTITGSLVDCNNLPLTTGRISFLLNGFYRYPNLVNGNFTLAFTSATSNFNLQYAATNSSGYVQPSGTVAVHSGNNVIPPIQVCPTHTIIGKLVDCNGVSIAGAAFNVKFINSSNPYAVYAATADASGNFKLEVNGGNDPAITYWGNDKTKNLDGIPVNGTANPGLTNLGNIVVCGTHTVTGTATNCINTPVVSGEITATVNGNNYSAKIVNGNFSLNFTPSTNNLSITYFVEDDANNQASTNKTVSIIPGNNNIGNTQACGVNNLQFINYTIDGVSYTHTKKWIGYYLNQNTPLQHQIVGYADSTTSQQYNQINFNIEGSSIGGNFLQSLGVHTPTGNGYTNFATTNTLANLTEVATSAGGFTAGDFSTVVTELVNGVNTNHIIQCSFRVKRNY